MRKAGSGRNRYRPSSSPRTVQAKTKFALGTQSVAPGGYVREHAHTDADEIIHFLAGEGVAVIDGVEHAVAPGTTLFLGAGHAHSFINRGAGALTFLWCITPNSLEDFFAAIGRPRKAGDAR